MNHLSPGAADGRANPEDVRKAITPKTILITIMYAKMRLHHPPMAESARLPDGNRHHHRRRNDAAVYPGNLADFRHMD